MLKLSHLHFARRCLAGRHTRRRQVFGSSASTWKAERDFREHISTHIPPLRWQLPLCLSQITKDGNFRELLCLSGYGNKDEWRNWRLPCCHRWLAAEWKGPGCCVTLFYSSLKAVDPERLQKQHLLYWWMCTRVMWEQSLIESCGVKEVNIAEQSQRLDR